MDVSSSLHQGNSLQSWLGILEKSMIRGNWEVGPTGSRPLKDQVLHSDLVEGPIFSVQTFSGLFKGDLQFGESKGEFEEAGGFWKDIVFRRKVGRKRWICFFGSKEAWFLNIYDVFTMGIHHPLNSPPIGRILYFLQPPIRKDVSKS